MNRIDNRRLLILEEKSKVAHEGDVHEAKDGIIHSFLNVLATGN